VNTLITSARDGQLVLVDGGGVSEIMTLGKQCPKNHRNTEVISLI
jgi:hypothetical protein